MLPIILYLLFSATGFWAVVKFFTLPHWDPYYKRYDHGLDLSWCELFWMAVICLLPTGNIAANVFWLWVLRQQIPWRPLIRWPKIPWPKCNLPKCPIAIRGKSKETV